MIYQCFHKPFSRTTLCQWVCLIGVGDDHKTWTDPFDLNIEASDFVFNYFFNDEQFSALTGLMTVPDLAPYLVLFERTNLSTAFNMFVMRRDTFNHYCSDLFAVINEVFRRIGPREDFYLKRYPGFLAERFLTPWMRVNVLKVAEVPYVRIDRSS